MSTIDTKVDFVAVIHSLPAKDAGVVHRSISHLHDLLGSEGRIPVREFRASNLIQLRCAFVAIRNEAERTGTPLVHIEMHASEDEGLILCNGEQMGWLELSKLLSMINVHTRNTMMVVACVCFSIQVIFPPRIREPAPFALLVAPAAEVTNATIESKIQSFYTALFREHDAESALNCVTPEMELFFPERKLFDVMRGVVWQYIGRRGSESRERVLSTILEELPPGHGHTLASLRKTILLYKDDFEKDNLMGLVGVFMCGREPYFTADDLKAPPVLSS